MLSKHDKAVLLERMMLDDPEVTICEFQEVVDGKRVFVPKKREEVMQPVAPARVFEFSAVKKKAACVVPQKIEVIEYIDNVIKTIAVAKKVGFAAGVTPGSIYGREKGKWRFRIGDNHLALQTAFRESYKEGKQYYEDVLNGVL
jgi:hypothetical protein